MYCRTYYGTKAPVQAFYMSEPQHGGFNMSAGLQEHERPLRRVLEAKVKKLASYLNHRSEQGRSSVKAMLLSKSDFRAKHSVILCCCKQSYRFRIIENCWSATADHQMGASPEGCLDLKQIDRQAGLQHEAVQSWCSECCDLNDCFEKCTQARVKCMFLQFIKVRMFIMTKDSHLWEKLLWQNISHGRHHLMTDVGVGDYDLNLLTVDSTTVNS